MSEPTKIPAEDMAHIRAARADANMGLLECDLIDHIDAIEAEHIAALRAVSSEWSAERERVKSEVQALRELVRELAEQLRQSKRAEDPDTLDRYHVCCLQDVDHEHAPDCATGRLLERARSVTNG